MTSPTSAETLISSVLELKAFLSSIPPSSTIYLDLEGTNLSRHGTISLITVLIHPENIVRIIDVAVLGKAAFTTATNDGKTLKTILEDPSISKCAWDIRNDADALWALDQVGLAGVTDIQLLENASRYGAKTYVCGLDKSIQSDLKLGFMATNRWIRTKKEVQSLMGADIFAARPIEAKIISYCVNDVIHLPALHALYSNRIGADWLTKVREESALRVAIAHSPAYEPQSSTKKLGPWGSGTGTRIISLDEMMDNFEVEKMEEFDRTGFFDDDIGYYDCNEWDDFDDWGTNAADAAICAEDFDSCWDKSG